MEKNMELGHLVGVQGLGIKALGAIVENQMEKNMETNMNTEFYWGA